MKERTSPERLLKEALFASINPNHQSPLYCGVSVTAMTQACAAVFYVPRDWSRERIKEFLADPQKFKPDRPEYPEGYPHAIVVPDPEGIRRQHEMLVKLGVKGPQFPSMAEAADDSGHSRPFPASWWSEDDGDVLWWCWKDGAWLGEPPYVGSPLDLGYTVELHARDAKHHMHRMNVGGWPGYHTHWTRLPPMPPAPEDNG